MIKVQLLVGGSLMTHEHEADGFFFRDGILYVTRMVRTQGSVLVEEWAAHPQVVVAGVEKTPSPPNPSA